MSSSVTKVVKTSVSPLLTLRKLNGPEGASKPLVLFFEWLRAPTAAVDKYCNLYHSRGMDVLTVQGNLGPFLMPKKAAVASRALLDYIISSEATKQRPFLLVHSFSIGAYLYSVFLMEIERNMEKYEVVSNSIRGQVFDSIVIGSLDHMGEAIAIASNANKLVSWTIRTGMASYFAINRSTVVPFYEKAISAFKNNFIKGPVLMFYSLNDPMADPASMEAVISKWNTDPQFKLWYKCWNNSSHAEHLRLHSDDYISSLNRFLNRHICQPIETFNIPKSKL